MLRLAQGLAALPLVRVAAVASACAAGGCGLFVDFEDGATATAAAAGPSSASSAGGAGGGGLAGSASSAGGGAAGGSGGASDACHPDWSSVTVLGVWPDETLVAMVPVEGGVAVANRTPSADSPNNVGARDLVVRMVHDDPQRADTAFLVGADDGNGAVRGQVALGRLGNQLVVATSVASGAVEHPLVSSAAPGLVAMVGKPDALDTATVIVDCASPSVEAATVAVGPDNRIAVAANTFTPSGTSGTMVSCGACPPTAVPFNKDLLLWSEADKDPCPLQVGSVDSNDASPSLAFLDKDLVLSANYTAPTDILELAIPFGSTPPTGTDVDRFVALLTGEPAQLATTWARPVARVWKGGTPGTFVHSTLGSGVVIGGGLWGESAPFESFEEPPRRMVVMAHVDKDGDIDDKPPFTALTAAGGFLRSLEAQPQCSLVAGIIEDTDQPWLANGGAARPSFVALVDTTTLQPMSGLALGTDVELEDPTDIVAARTEKAIVVAAVYEGEAVIAGHRLPPGNPWGTVLLRVGP